MCSRLRRRARTQHQSWSWDGGERSSREQLRIVTPAGALVGVGPPVIEDVFAVGVSLCVERDRSDYRTVRAGESKMLRCPPGARHRRSAFLERVQEGVRDTWITTAGAGIPG